jgi:ATPase subunit of ABC transporter with duplicated ATPase domains
MTTPKDSQAPVPGTILVRRQQTRFHINEDDVSKEIDIKDLDVSIVTDNLDVIDTITTARTSKFKKSSQGLEILTGAELRLKTGVHYALVGRNGTGKSTILRALAERLIPGVPMSIRVAILQQTAAYSDGFSATANATTINNTPDLSTLALAPKTVLQQVVEGDLYRNQLVHELEILTKGIESGDGDALAPVRAFRKVKHERLQREFFEVQKTANLRSGARGFDARKVLIQWEKKMIDFEETVAQKDEEITSETIQAETKEAVDIQAELQTQLETMKIADIESKARTILMGLGFKEPQLEKPFSTLSGGWRMRCMLAAALTHTADIIILDEPTNYLDLLGIIWLERHLIALRESSSTTLVLVSHDRAFVDATCSEIIILRDLKLTYFNGNLSAYEKSIRHKILRMTRMKDAQDKQIAHMNQTIANNIKQGKKTGDDNKLRQAKSRQKKVDDRMGLNVSDKGGRFKLNRDLAGYYLTGRAGIEIPKEERATVMHFPPAPELRFPGSLLSLEKVTYTYPRTPKPQLQDIDLVIHPGDRVGIVGLNGCGKSTLIRLLVELAKPTSGTIARHARLKVGYYSQHAVEDLQALGLGNPSLTALALLLRDSDLEEPQARALLGSLGLSGRTASDIPLGKLSGGQLVRLALALLLWSPPHLFVLDEPTTHLDFHTVKALCGALAGYEGAVVVVTHDRFLVRTVVQGEAVDEEDGDEESDEEDGGAAARGGPAGDGVKMMRMLYEIKGGKLVVRKDVEAWEKGLEGRLKKLSLM